MSSKTTEQEVLILCDMIGTVPEKNNPDPDYTVRKYKKILNQKRYFDDIKLLGGLGEGICVTFYESCKCILPPIFQLHTL